MDPERFLSRTEPHQTLVPGTPARRVRATPVDLPTAIARLDAVREVHGRIARLRRQVAFSRRLHADAPPMVVRPEKGDPEWALDLAEQQAWWGELWFETGMLRLDAAETLARTLDGRSTAAAIAELCDAAEEARKSFEEAAGHYRLVQRVHRRIRKRGWHVAVSPERP